MNRFPLGGRQASAFVSWTSTNQPHADAPQAPASAVAAVPAAATLTRPPTVPAVPRKCAVTIVQTDPTTRAAEALIQINQRSRPLTMDPSPARPRAYTKRPHEASPASHSDPSLNPCVAKKAAYEGVASPTNPPVVPAREAVISELLNKLANQPTTAALKQDQFNEVDDMVAGVPYPRRHELLKRMVKAIEELPAEKRFQAVCKMATLIGLHMNEMAASSFMDVFKELRSVSQCLTPNEQSFSIKNLENLAGRVPRQERGEAIQVVIDSLCLIRPADRVSTFVRVTRQAMTGTKEQRGWHLRKVLQNLTLLDDSPTADRYTVYGAIRQLAEMQPADQHTAALQHLLGEITRNSTGMARTLAIRGLLISAKGLPPKSTALLAADLNASLGGMAKTFVTGIRDKRAAPQQIADFRDMASIAKSLNQFDHVRQGTPALTLMKSLISSADQSACDYSDDLKKILLPHLMALKSLNELSRDERLEAFSHFGSGS